MEKSLMIDLGDFRTEGDLNIPPNPKALVVFAHGSGSGKNSPRNQFVADSLNKRGFATFLTDMYSKREFHMGLTDFNLQLLADRFQNIILKLKSYPILSKLPVVLYGSSTGAAVALVVAAKLKSRIHAVVSRGGRTDLADDILHLINAPILLLAGENDPIILNINRKAIDLIHTQKALKIIPNASHLFEEEGAIEAVSAETGNWLETHLSKIPENLTGLINHQNKHKSNV